ncbi:hypothetical protein WJX73_008089 [Symbiochloris irregularis]|uniref:Uncharacterized protein n=1 Tax=Symbiochloris irregularis TaxID=706552 RepID=A0AAW1NXP5_9CHLO
MVADSAKPASFLIKFREARRSLTREQLKKAPESLLSTVLLGDDLVSAGNDTLEIPADETASVPGLVGWHNGTVALFQICMDCYLEIGERVLLRSARPLESAASVTAALDYFNIPDELRPPGVRLVMRTLALREDHKNRLRRFMTEAVQMMDSEFGSAHPAFQMSLQKEPTASFYFSKVPVLSNRTTFTLGIFSLQRRTDYLGRADPQTGARQYLDALEQQEMTLAGQALQVSVKFSDRRNDWGAAIMELSCNFD